MPVPINLDALIETDHPARTVWAFVEQLDLEPLRRSIRSVEGHAGAPATDPAILVALWLWATIDGVGSARELDRLCTRHSVYRWLCGGITLNYHTLADFRTGHTDWLDAVLVKSIASLVERKLVTLTTIAQDGMRVRASAKAASFRRRARLEQHLREARERVRILKQELGGDGLTQRQKAARARAAREREQRLSEALATMARIEIERAPKSARRTASGGGDGSNDPPAPGAPGAPDGAKSKASGPRVSSTDPEARVMKMADGGFRPAFNIQIAVDVDTGLVVGVEVTNLGSDMRQMPPMHERVLGDYELTPERWLVDGGYANHAAIGTVEAGGTEVLAPVPASRKAGVDPYDPKPSDSAAVARWRTRMSTDEAREQYKDRAASVECVHAHERGRGLRQFPVRGVIKARAVALWHALAEDVVVMMRRGWVTVS